MLTYIMLRVALSDSGIGPSHSKMLTRRLMEIESRLLPCGLHVVGSPPTAAEAVATLVNIAEIDRPENQPPTRGLPGVLARAVGRDIEQIYVSSNKARCWGHGAALAISAALPRVETYACIRASSSFADPH